MRLRTSLAAVLIALASSTATAQTTLGDVLDKGAKKISAKEATKVFLTGVLRGKTSRGGLIEVFYKPDGTFTGTVAGEAFSDAKWRITGDQVCADWWIPKFNLSKDNLCVYWFRLENVFYYTQESDSDRDEEVAIRTFTPQ